MPQDTYRDPALEWLDHVQPVGLVVAPTVLKDLILEPIPQTQADTLDVDALLDPDPARPALRDPWAFAETILQWDARLVAGASGGPPLPSELIVSLPEHGTVLAPTWVVAERGPADMPWQLIVVIEPAGVDPDVRAAQGGWEATPHQRFERLLRETGVPAGVMITDRELRLVYAPKGETSGWLAFPLRALATVAGRPMLAGLRLMLDRARLFTDADDRRLPAVLRKSREAQASVSTELAGQVLGALHELLRGLHAAEPDLIRDLARERPSHLYEGLLTVLMRLVFVLYAEDRDLLPSLTDGRSRALYDGGYSARGLYARLVEDAALNPDTMDERRGGWGRMLALFRLIHAGHPSRFVQARGGKLFDPDVFPFLEGRRAPEEPPRVATVSDGCLLRVLEGLMTLEGRGPAGLRSRERLSYRTLDVEQIGSVYEAVMGFTVQLAQGPVLAIKAGKNNRTPVFVDLDALLARKGKDRIKALKDDYDRAITAKQAAPVEKAATNDELAAALDGLVDERGSPARRVAPAGTPVLQPTDERRRTGSHYTPRSLTEPIVRHALEPAFERLGPDATPKQVLDLKVCDPAMGSGAFLVEATRAIAARLVTAWARWPETRPFIPPDEDEDLHARRLVAQRCIYGVDKNPLAVDLAKLSLWLATLARDHEFTFLDHALKAGDSLVGLGRAQIAAVHWDAKKPGLPLFRGLIADGFKAALQAREDIRSAPDDVGRAIQEQRHRSVESRIAPLRAMGDAIVAAFFASGKPREREKQRATLESWITGSIEPDWGRIGTLADSLAQGERVLQPFHWEMEFPEVFSVNNEGFDALIGNPPFAGGTKISGQYGDRYLNYIQEQCTNSGNRMDLVGYFLRKSYSLVCDGGCVGLIGTNTLSQGDTRTGGLSEICRQGGSIFRAEKRIAWPGEAAVVVCAVHVKKGSYSGAAVLNGKAVDRISAFLIPAQFDYPPQSLAENARTSFEGFMVAGQGFLFDDNDPDSNPMSLLHELIDNNIRNGEVIFPYIGGKEVNSDPQHRPYRFAINFGNMSETEARMWPDVFDIVERRVKPERDEDSRKSRKDRWWQYGETRPGLVRAVKGKENVLVCSQTGTHVCFCFLETNLVWSTKLKIFTRNGWDFFACMQSRVHDFWARFFSSTMKDDPVYVPTDCYENFPFPQLPDEGLGMIGQNYYAMRAGTMVARREGMTKTYNRFHDRTETALDILRLRELHAEMDRAVLSAFGWDDLAARAEPVFLDETNEDDHTYQGRLFWPATFRDEVLARLLALNAERHAEEVRLGIAPGMKGRAIEDQDEDA